MNRLDLVKLVAGGCLAVSFTATVFGPMGLGQRYVDELKHRVRADLQARQLDDVEVAMESDPSLRRVVVLSGDVSPRDRATAVAVSRSVAGVADVRWAAAGSVGGRGQSGLAVRY